MYLYDNISYLFQPNHTEDSIPPEQRIELSGEEENFLNDMIKDSTDVEEEEEQDMCDQYLSKLYETDKAKQAPDLSKDETCNICLDQILERGQLFGLLEQ